MEADSDGRAGEWHDLTRRVESGMQVFPGDPEVSLDLDASIPADGYRVHSLSCGSHTGTHVDAPSHTEPDGATVDELPVDRFVLDAALVDCSGLEPRSPIGPADLPETDADALVIHTGWADRWGEPSYFDHPYLTPEAAAFCVEAGYDVATDTLNPDPTPTERTGAAEPTGFVAHHELLGNGQLIVENLANLADLPSRFELVVAPLKLAACDGAPVRAIARE
jgi:kynurenine formamidase